MHCPISQRQRDKPEDPFGVVSVGIRLCVAGAARGCSELWTTKTLKERVWTLLLLHQAPVCPLPQSHHQAHQSDTDKHTVAQTGRDTNSLAMVSSGSGPWVWEHFSTHKNHWAEQKFNQIIWNSATALNVYFTTLFDIIRQTITPVPLEPSSSGHYANHRFKHFCTASYF